MIIFPVLGVGLVIFGVLFLFTPSLLLRITKLANTVVPMDQHIFKHRFLVGAFLLISSVVMYWVSRTLAGMDTWLSGLSIVLGAIFLVFAALLVFVPRWVEKMNDVGGKVIATDEITLVYRKSTGTLLILIGLYMIYSRFS